MKLKKTQKRPIYEIRTLKYDTDCTRITARKWDSLMEGAVKANGRKIRSLIRKFLPDLYENLALNFYNPYEHQCVRTKTHFVYIHSGIEYFLKYEY